MEGQGFNNLDGAFHTLMNWQYKYRIWVYNSEVDCTSVPADGGMRENADEASGIQAVASWMQVAVCNWHRVIMFISCS